MEEKRRKTEKGEVDEEGFAIGRILGVIKRKDPELYEELLSIAKSDGARGSDIVYDALQLYRDFRLFSGADPRCIAYAMRMIEVMMRRVLEMLAFIQQYMNADFFARQLSMYQALAEQLRAQPEEEEAEEKKKVELPSTAREKLTNLMVDMTMMLMKNLVNMLSTTMMRPPISTPQPQQTVQPPSLLERRPKIIMGEKSGGGGQASGSRYENIEPARGTEGKSDKDTNEVSEAQGNTST